MIDPVKYTAAAIFAMNRNQLELAVAELQYKYVDWRANYRCDESDEAQEAVVRALKVKEDVKKLRRDQSLCSCGLPREPSPEHRHTCLFYAT